MCDRVSKTCWGLSKMTVKNVTKDYYVTQHMVFVEFLEFLCRLAYASSILTNYELESDESDKEGLLRPKKE